MNAIDVSGLLVEVADSGVEIVSDVSFSVAPGEILGVVGESGCGKTTASLAILGGARPGARIVQGTASVDGRSMLNLPGKQLQIRRGKDVAYVSQDPAAALNPSLRIGRQLREMLDVHAPQLDSETKATRVRAALDSVRLPIDEEFTRRYPHQLSGGQLQRVAIAMAAILGPRAIVMDEPTTGLDVATQAHILEAIRELCRSQNVGIVYISHDLAVVGTIADRVLVLYAGRVVEDGPTHALINPIHPYTRGLVGAIPVISQARQLSTIPGRPPRPGHHPTGCRFAERCSFHIEDCDTAEPALVEIGADHFVRCLRAPDIVDQPLPTASRKFAAEPERPSATLLRVTELSASYHSMPVLQGVSFDVAAGQCVALVGESGSGKSTLGRSLVGLNGNWTGEVSYRGALLESKARCRSAKVRKAIQYVFQSPYNSLNPRRTVAESVGSPLAQFTDLGKSERAERVRETLELVALGAHVADRYPEQLSGGERQRVSIARALICEPDMLICDEITSALDVSVQASIVQLLEQLRRERNLAILFITHNLALVRSIADRVLVLNAGKIVESGPTESVMAGPVDPYTRTLLDNTPTFDHEADLLH